MIHSADTRQLVTGQHVQEPHAAHTGANADLADRSLGDAADNAGVTSVGMIFHNSQDLRRIPGLGDDNHFAFIGQIQGIKTQDVADGQHFRPDGNVIVIQHNAHIRLTGHFVEGCRQTAPRRIAQQGNVGLGGENIGDETAEGCAVADNAIRQDLLIRNEDELIHAMNHFELRGGGGTDFRPAFEYVNQLCAEKKFSNLRGLLYFTDGMGTYPARRPAYDTAFLFLGEKFDDANVPPWAMKVVLDEDEFSGPTARAASTLADALAEEDDPYRELNNS